MNMSDDFEFPRYKQSAGSGVAVGVVSNNFDPEGLGRVKVTFVYWGEQRESDWCRVAAPLAGMSRGAWFVPEVGDEVVVGFHLGDTNRPIVLGGLWNSEKRPPGNTETMMVRKIKTTAGHEILFDDMPESSKITLSTATGIQLNLEDEQQKVTIGYLTDPATSITMSPEQGISLTVGDNRISLSVEGGITIETAETMKLVGESISLVGTEISLAGTNVSITAEAAVEVSAEGVVEIEGALVKLN